MSEIAMDGKKRLEEGRLHPLRGLMPRVVVALVFALVPFFLLLNLSLVERKAEAEESARRSAASLLSVVAERYRDQLDTARETLFLLSRAEDIRSGRWDQVRELLMEIKSGRPQFDDLGVADSQGNVVVSAVRSPASVNVADREYFQEAMSSRRLAVSGFLVSRLTGNRIVMFAYPVLDESGSVRLVLLAPLNLLFVNRLLDEIGIPRGCQVMVTDTEGNILVSLPGGEEMAGREVDDEELLHYLREVGDGELTTSRRRVYLVSTVDHPEQELGLCHVVIGYDHKDIYGPARTDFARNLAILSLISALAFILTLFFLSRSVIRPVKDLVSLVSRVGRGDGGDDIEGVVERECSRRAPGEIGMLRSSFIDMLGRIRAREVERDRALERARRLGRFYAMLSATNRAIVHCRDEVELMEQICRTAVEEGGFRLAWVGKLMDEEGTVEVVAGYGATGYLESLKVKVWEGEEARGPTGTALREGRPVACEDIASDPLMAPWRERALSFGFRSSCALPLYRRGRA